MMTFLYAFPVLNDVYTGTKALICASFLYLRCNEYEKTDEELNLKVVMITCALIFFYLIGRNSEKVLCSYS